MTPVDRVVRVETVSVNNLGKNKKHTMNTTVQNNLLSRAKASMTALLSAAAVTWSTGQAIAGFGPDQSVPGAINLTPGVDYTLGNYAYSPPLRKFLDKLPGLTSSGTNGLGQYIPVAIPNTPYGSPYANCQYYEIGLVEYFERMHQDLPAAGTKLRGYVQIVPSTYAGAVPLDKAHGLSMNVTNKSGQLLYGADKPHYMGPMIVAFKNIPVRVKFSNLLPTGPAGRIFLPTDTTIGGAGDGPNQIGVDANGAPVYEQYTQNRANIHLHGGFPPWISDGTPHQWIAPAGETTSYHKGPDALNVPDMPDPGDGSMTYYWPNLQSGRLLWYHDHTYGATGPNVYAGEAAPYLIVDQEEETGLAAAGVPGVLAAGPNATNDLDHLITLVIQDKTFVPDTATLKTQDPLWLTDVVDGMTGVAPVMGSLWMPHVYVPNQWPNNPDGSGANGLGRWDYGPWFWPPWIVNTPYPPRVSHCPESFNDTPVVNGQPYPYIDVQPAKYRIKFLDASDDRYWNLQMYVASPIISNIVVTAGGSGYNPNLPPSIRISGGGGRGARATANVDANGTVTDITINVAGSGYTNAPTITIEAPEKPGGVQATAEAQIYTGKTEVGLVEANSNIGISFPASWMGFTSLYEILDGRPGGIPDPSTRGPAFVKIANEGGVLPNPVVIGNTPVGFERNLKNIVVLNVLEHSLWLAPAERADTVVDFTHFAGKTIILYNDAPAALPAADTRNDTYAEDGDQTGGGGPGNTDPGVGPNTRTVMQFRVAAASAATPNADSTAPADDYDANMLAALADPATGLPAIFGSTQPMPVVPEEGYSSVGYPGGSTGNTYARIQDSSLTFIPYGSTTPVTIPFKSKCIQELFDENGRLNATLGTEVPFTNNGNQTTVPLNYVDPITELFNDGETQIWKITHNGVDAHCVHFHLVNVQIVNRVGWDGQVVPPDDDELGWKETVRMYPLQDIIVATRAVSVPSPFGVSNSWRYLNPAQPPGSPIGFSNWDPLTGNGLAEATTNVMFNFNWAYIWHCHLLGHEENDMMRPISMVVDSYLPPAPVVTGIPVITGASSASALLTWTDGTPYNYTTGLPASTVGNPTNEIGFRIERASASTGIYAVVTNVPANTTSFVDATAPFPSTNLYRVVAFNTAGDSVSAAKLVLLVPTIAAVPVALAVRSVLYPAQANVELNWVNSTTLVKNMVVQRAPGTTTNWVTLATLGATASNYTDTNVAFNTTYNYRVQSVNTGRTSPYSNAANLTVPPAAPTGLLGSATSVTNVNLAWSANGSGKSGFRVERSTDGVAFAFVSSVASNTVAYSDKTAISGVTYIYRVFATNSGGDSLPSNPATVTTPTVPLTPGNLQISPESSTDISLSWLNVATNATGLRIDRALGAGAFTVLVRFNTNISAYADTTVTSGNTYTYRVYATNIWGASLPATATTTAPNAAPPTPTGLKVRASSLSPVAVTLTWVNPVTPLGATPTAFYVERNSGGGPYLPIATLAGASVTNYTDTNTSFNLPYGYRVRAGNGFGFSTYATVASMTWPPTGPAALTASSTVFNKVALTWLSGLNQTGYRLERAVGAGAFAPLANLAAAAVAYTDTNSVLENTTYSYRVFGTNTGGDSLPSNIATVTTPLAPPIPAAPTRVTATLTGMNPANIAISWTGNTNNVLSYVIQRSAGAGAFVTLTTLTGAGVTNYNDATVVSGTTYTYQVSAVGLSGASPYTLSSAVTVVIAYVQSASAAAVASATTVSTPALAAQTLGDLNVVVVGWHDVTRAVSSVVDSLGNTYTLAGTTTGNGISQAVYYGKTLGGAGNRVTVTFNGAATTPEVSVLEYSGVSALDRFGGATGTAASATTGNPGNTTSANELVFSAATTATTVTAGTGFASRLNTTTGIAQDKVLARTGSSTATATVSGTTATRKWVIQTVSFK